MKRVYRMWMGAMVFLAPFLATWSANAEEPRFALGGGVSAFSTEVQGDLEIHRRVGIEAAIGAPFGGDLAWSAGGHLLLTHKHVAPYIGALYASERWGDSWWYAHRFDTDRRDAHLFGPTVGVRLRERRTPGLGGFVQLELLEDLDRGAMAPSIGAGIAWWF